MDLSFLSAKRLAVLVRRGEIGCLELLDRFIARVEHLDGRTNAVVVRDFDCARKRARTLDRGRKQGTGKSCSACR
jgi:amidase